MHDEISRGPGAEEFLDDLALYQRFRSDCYGDQPDPTNIDYEDFLAFLDFEHHLGLSGSDTWSNEGNRTQVVVKALIGAILVERTPPTDRLPDLYYSFARELRPGDYVITFNYDNLLERALDHVGRAYRLCHQGERERGNRAIEEDDVVVLKLHGSVDWFDRSSYEALEAELQKHGAQVGAGDPVFGPGAEVETTRVCLGVHASDPLAKAFRVTRGLEHLYARRPLYMATPLLLTPSHAKAIYANRFAALWYGLGQAGGMNYGLAVIGYSLPKQDDYATQALFRLVRNYQESWWDRQRPGAMKKSPVLLVDLQKSEEDQAAYRKHYGFVESEKAIFQFKGFNETSVRSLSELAAAS